MAMLSYFRQILAFSAVRRGHSELTQRRKVARRQIPLELLAREWLSEQKAGVDTRTYLVEKLLPTLVVGVEKLLTEVSLRGIAECQEMHPDFNPVNYLAQYLMRNNPCYGSSTEAHPYCRTLCEVSEELKKIALSVDENELERLKRREERERREAVRAQEERHRADVLKEVFAKWSPEKLGQVGSLFCTVGWVRHHGVGGASCCCTRVVGGAPCCCTRVVGGAPCCCTRVVGGAPCCCTVG